jgi:hypothetical protein
VREEADTEFPELLHEQGVEASAVDALDEKDVGRLGKIGRFTLPTF